VTGPGIDAPDSPGMSGNDARTKKRRERILQIWPSTHRETEGKTSAWRPNEHLYTQEKKGTGIAGRAMLQRSQCCHQNGEKGSRKARCSETLSKWGEGIVYGPA